MLCSELRVHVEDMSKLVFFDCEFTDLAVSGSIISAGFVAEGGEDFYAELAGFKESECNDFVKATVLPLLSRQCISIDVFIGQLTQWLGNLDSDLVLVADSDWDRKMLNKTFDSAGMAMPASWLFRKVPDYFSSGQQRQVFSDETAAYFLRYPEEKPHHALADARAIRSAYLRAETGW